MSSPIDKPHPAMLGRRAKKFPKKPSLVSLEDAAASDVNRLMAQYRKNGTMPSVAMQKPLYGDFTGPQDLHNQIEAVDAAFDTFNQLPAAVRSACKNSPVKFLELFEDPDQRDMLEAAGLIIQDTPLDNIPNPPSELGGKTVLAPPSTPEASEGESEG